MQRIEKRSVSKVIPLEPFLLLFPLFVFLLWDAVRKWYKTFLSIIYYDIDPVCFLVKSFDILTALYRDLIFDAGYKIMKHNHLPWFKFDLVILFFFSKIHNRVHTIATCDPSLNISISSGVFLFFISISCQRYWQRCKDQRVNRKLINDFQTRPTARIAYLRFLRLLGILMGQKKAIVR